MFIKTLRWLQHSFSLVFKNYHKEVVWGQSHAWVKSLRATLQGRFWGCLWVECWTWANRVGSQSRKQIVSWAASKEAWPACQGGESAPPHHPCEIPHGVQHPALGFSAHERHGSFHGERWSRSRGRPQIWSEGWRTSPTKTGWESWDCSAWRRDGSGETSLDLPVA